MPTLVLDVDGVLSPYGPTTPDPAWGDGWHDVAPTLNGVTYSLDLHPAMGSAIGSLTADRVWLTTWDDRANDHVATTFGWDPMPFIGPWQRMDGSHSHKFAALLNWIADTDPDGPVVWVDDELAGPHGQLHGTLAYSLKDRRSPTGRLADLLVDDRADDARLLDQVIPYPVDRHVGLTVDDIDRIGRLLTGDPQGDTDPWTVRFTAAATGPPTDIGRAPAGWQDAHRYAQGDVYDVHPDLHRAWATPVRL